MLSFNLEQLTEARTKLDEEIENAQEQLVEEAREMIIKADIGTPTEEQLGDIALILSGTQNMSYDFTRKTLECWITFSMEKGVLI